MTALGTQFAEEFSHSGIQVARSAALLEDGDSLGWQTSGDLRKSLPCNVLKPARIRHKGILSCQGIQLYGARDLSLVGEQERDARQGDHQFPEFLVPACPVERSSEMLPRLVPVVKAPGCQPDPG
jgi:hypothetical protein